MFVLNGRLRLVCVCDSDRYLRLVSLATTRVEILNSLLNAEHARQLSTFVFNQMLNRRLHCLPIKTSALCTLPHSNILQLSCLSGCHSLVF